MPCWIMHGQQGREARGPLSTRFPTQQPVRAQLSPRPPRRASCTHPPCSSAPSPGSPRPALAPTRLPLLLLLPLLQRLPPQSLPLIPTGSPRPHGWCPPLYGRLARRRRRTRPCAWPADEAGGRRRDSASQCRSDLEVRVAWERPEREQDRCLCLLEVNTCTVCLSTLWARSHVMGKIAACNRAPEFGENCTLTRDRI